MIGKVILVLVALILVTSFWMDSNDIKVEFSDLTQLKTLLIKDSMVVTEEQGELDLEKIAIEKGIIEETPLIKAGREYRNK